MKTLKTVMIAISCMILGGAAAEAADLFTPPLFVGDNQLVACEIVNVGGKTRTFQLEIIDSAGIVQGSGGNTLAPGQSGGGGIASSSIFGLFYCHFIVQGGVDNFRAAIKLRSSALGSGDLVTLPAN
jgi:hypothetical protein